MYEQPSKIRQFALTIITLSIVVGAVALGVMLSKQEKPEPELASAGIQAGDKTLGNKDSKVQLVEYGDFQCPACAATEPVVKQLLVEHGQEFWFAFRHLPLKEIHKNAAISGYAAEAASLQGKFWEMKEKLYTRQSEWSALPDPSPKFQAYAQELGLDPDKFVRDMASDEVVSKVESENATARSHGFNSTPTFVLNGKKIGTPSSYEGFVKIIQDAQQ
jgi:protein-disulfide isomerase